MRFHKIFLCVCAISPMFAQGIVVRITPLTLAQQAQGAFKQHRAFYIEGFGTYYGGPISIVAQDVAGNDARLEFKGSVEIKTDAMTLTADQVVFNISLHTMEPSGNVKLLAVAAK